MSKLLDELKRLFKTPQDAVRALGLDERLLAMDGKPLGRDESFEKVEHSLAHKKGVHDPKALAAWIGREHGKIKGSNDADQHGYAMDPLTSKGEEIMRAMQKQYGAEKGKQVFYASKNAGKITGVDAADMDPAQFAQLSRLFGEFMKEEAREPEHRDADAQDDWSPEARAAAAEARKKNAAHHTAERDRHRTSAREIEHPQQSQLHRAASRAHEEARHAHEVDEPNATALSKKAGIASNKADRFNQMSARERTRDSALAGDSKRGLNMTKPKTTLSAATARGALMNYLAPRLAADAKMPALMPIVQGVTRENFVDRIPAMVSKLRVAAHGRLAQDADLEDAAEVLEAIARVTGGGEMDDEPGEDDMMSTDPNAGMPMGAGEGGEGGEDDEEEPAVEESEPRHVELLRDIREFCKDKMSPEDCAKLDEMIGEVVAHGAGDDEDDMEDDGTGQDEPPPFAGKPEVGGKMDKEESKAMDSAAITKAIEVAVARERERGREVTRAIEAVRPWVGAVDQAKFAFDSAADVFKHALDALKVSTKGVHPDAYRPILEAQPRPGSRREQHHRVALDAAAEKSFTERFSNAARVQRA